MSDIAIRPATVADLTALTDLDRRVFGKISYPYFVFRQLLDLCDGGLIVASKEDRVYGYALVGKMDDRPDGYFMSLGVDADLRGRGLGRRLAESGVARARELGVRRLKLTVEPTNGAAIGLYRTLGFSVVAESRDYFGPDEPRTVMELPIQG